MGRSRSRRQEDLEGLGDLAMARMRDALADAAPDARALKAQQREERRRRREAESRRSFLAVGVGLLTGGLAMSQMPTVAAVGLAFLAAALTVYLLKGFSATQGLFGPREAKRAAARIESPRLAESIPAARREVVSRVLQQATEELQKLEAARGRLTDAGAAAIVERLLLSGQRLSAAVATQPERLDQAQRLFTYHLPQAVYVTQLLADLETTSSDDHRRRLQDARLVLARMDNLFEKIELEFRAGDGREMDLELRLINQALDEDLGAERKR